MSKKQKILLTTVAATVVLGIGATTFIINAVADDNNSWFNFMSQKQVSTKVSSSSQTNAVIASSTLGSSSFNNKASSSSSSAVTSTSSSSTLSQQSAVSSTSAADTTTNNTITQDDFRESDDIAYRAITLYGLAHGDSQWQRLNLLQSKGITLTKVANQSNPTFVAKATGDNGTAYYSYIMATGDNASQIQQNPLSFSQSNDNQYRTSITNVIDYVNQVGGRSALMKLKFQLNENTNN